MKSNGCKQGLDFFGNAVTKDNCFVDTVHESSYTCVYASVRRFVSPYAYLSVENFRRSLLLLALMLPCQSLMAWQWQDLWRTADQHAKTMMQKGQYKRAANTFRRSDWQATAQYRSGQYEKASQQFGELNTADGYYNQGNALAHMGKYEEAIEAYKDALYLNPKMADAKANKALLEKLLKEQQKQEHKQNQDKQNQDKQNQDKQNQDKQNQDKQNQDKQNQDKQNQDKQSQDKQNQDKQNQDKQNQDKQSQDKQNQDKQNQDKQNQDKQSQDKQSQDKQNQDKQNQDKQKSSQSKSAEAQPNPLKPEDEQKKQRLLRLVPDDPGGLLRQKFLRDYIRRQRGWQS